MDGDKLNTDMLQVPLNVAKHHFFKEVNKMIDVDSEKTVLTICQ